MYFLCSVAFMGVRPLPSSIPSSSLTCETSCSKSAHRIEERSCLVMQLGRVGGARTSGSFSGISLVLLKSTPKLADFSFRSVELKTSFSAQLLNEQHSARCSRLRSVVQVVPLHSLMAHFSLANQSTSLLVLALQSDCLAAEAIQPVGDTAALPFPRTAIARASPYFALAPMRIGFAPLACWIVRVVRLEESVVDREVRVVPWSTSSCAPFLLLPLMY